MAAFSLFGNVMSMESVQLVGANRDALLLSFKDAKVVLRMQDYDIMFDKVPLSLEAEILGD